MGRIGMNAVFLAGSDSDTAGTKKMEDSED